VTIELDFSLNNSGAHLKSVLAYTEKHYKELYEKILLGSVEVCYSAFREGYIFTIKGE
jgi:hypothetical protein